MPTATRTLPRLAGVLLLLAGAYVALQAYPSELAVPAAARRADLIATVLYDQAIVFVLRILILCAAAFTVLSIVVRIWNREWLTKAGPFEVERAVAVTEREHGDLEIEVADLRARYVELLERMLVSRERAASDDLLRRGASHVTD
jgi:hypothetical protein